MDRPAKIENGTCPLCKKHFANLKLRNRHIKRVHHQVLEGKPRKSRIWCPLCGEGQDNIKTYDFLRKHLQENHNINVDLCTFEFSNNQMFEEWKKLEKIETSYAMHRTSKNSDHKNVIYHCNRSDTRGYQSHYKKRAEKFGGTIKMLGVFCPSKLAVKIYDNGKKITVKFWKTHVGHDQESRGKHLSIAEKNMILEKLESGVSVDQILKDARNLETEKPERINLLTRLDIANLLRRHQIVVKTLKQQSQIPSGGETEIVQFIEEKETQQVTNQVDMATMRKLQMDKFNNYMSNLSDEVFVTTMKKLEEIMKEPDEAKIDTAKRKVEP